MNDIDRARELLQANGFVVLRAKSYHQAQERQRCAEALRQAAEDYAEHNQQWVEKKVGPEMRYYRDRCEFLYGAARAAGATVEELQGAAYAPAEVSR